MLEAPCVPSVHDVTNDLNSIRSLCVSSGADEKSGAMGLPLDDRGAGISASAFRLGQRDLADNILGRMKVRAFLRSLSCQRRPFGSYIQRMHDTTSNACGLLPDSFCLTSRQACEYVSSSLLRALFSLLLLSIACSVLQLENTL